MYMHDASSSNPTNTLCYSNLLSYSCGRGSWSSSWTPCRSSRALCRSSRALCRDASRAPCHSARTLLLSGCPILRDVPVPGPSFQSFRARFTLRDVDDACNMTSALTLLALRAAVVDSVAHELHPGASWPYARLRVRGVHRLYDPRTLVGHRRA